MDSAITVYKTPNPASELIKRDIFHRAIDSLNSAAGKTPITLMGHSRLVTNGQEEFNNNNQPVIKNGIVGIHNGIVVNERELWQRYTDLLRVSDLDSELILALLRRFYSSDRMLPIALKKMFDDIYGTASLALLFHDLNNLLLTTNNGSLYYVVSTDKNALIFASEYYILDMLIESNRIGNMFNPSGIEHLQPKTACLVDLETIALEIIQYENYPRGEFSTLKPRSKVIDIRDLSEADRKEGLPVNQNISIHVPAEFIRRFTNCEKKIQGLRRCSKCLLPETFPYIEYNADGVCNYCKNYRKWELQPQGTLEEYIGPFRNKSGKPDCIVTFSGGRDSSYGLHYVKNVLKLNPLAYSYDWGMITDLARRNQARLCGKLGVEHILISADIKKKRANIRKNVLAWLKRPNLGTIPLFMAGDKQYFYFANKLMEQNKIELVILCENMLETTNFKSGFCGIAPSFVKEHTYSMSIQNKLKMALFYGKQYLANPSYLNSSLFDTLGAFASYYFIPHNYLNMFNYIQWDEQVIDRTLKEQYDWETATDTNSTWRIGDGTAPFYNYIYYMLAGFTENDTFRSNQIREEIMTRDEGMKLIAEENKPRYQSIQWYCDTIGIDFNATMTAINSIQGLYER